MLCAAVDIGSNTTRVLVAEPQEGQLRKVMEQRAYTRIGKASQHNGAIDAEKVAELAEVVATQVRLAKEVGAEAIRTVGAMVPGGWPEVRAKNRALALAGRQIVCDALGTPLPCPEAFIGPMASIPLSDGNAEALGRRLYDEHRIEVPVFPWPVPPRRVVRLSAQLYNTEDDMRALARALLNSRDGDRGAGATPGPG